MLAKNQKWKIEIKTLKNPPNATYTHIYVFACVCITLFLWNERHISFYIFGYLMWKMNKTYSISDLPRTLYEYVRTYLCMYVYVAWAVNPRFACRNRYSHTYIHTHVAYASDSLNMQNLYSLLFIRHIFFTSPL